MFVFILELEKIKEDLIVRFDFLSNVIFFLVLELGKTKEGFLKIGMCIFMFKLVINFKENFLVRFDFLNIGMCILIF